MSESAEHRIEQAHVRRSPRYTMFFVVGAALGIIAALILTFAFDTADAQNSPTQVSYTATQVFGFLCLVCIPIGMALLGAVALIVDRRLSRRLREVRIDHERVEVIHDDSTADEQPATGETPR